jgi:hypothetical protein
VTMSIWKRYGYAWLTAGLFLFSLAGHWLFGWFAYLDEQRAHGRPIEVAGYVTEMARDTLENWQSEFLQLLWQVGGLAFFLFIGSPQSKEGMTGWRRSWTRSCTSSPRPTLSGSSSRSIGNIPGVRSAQAPWRRRAPRAARWRRLRLPAVLAAPGGARAGRPRAAGARVLVDRPQQHRQAERLSTARSSPGRAGRNHRRRSGRRPA